MLQTLFGFRIAISLHEANSNVVESYDTSVAAPEYSGRHLGTATVFGVCSQSMDEGVVFE